MITRIAVSLLLIGLLSTPAAPQGGCTTYHLWELSGGANGNPGDPNPSPGWLAQLANELATNGGGPANCTYTNNTPFGTLYGDCYGLAYTCTAPPAPPPAPPPTGPCPGGCAAGQPINLADGNTYIQQTDVRIPGLGSGLTLSRTWNSMWPLSLSGMNSGLFGVNWRSTYEERVFYGNDGTVKYTRADGSLWSFLLYGNPPTYQVISPANGRATLAQGASQWTITFDNGEKRFFDNTSGWLASIVDRNGNTTQLSYDSIARLVAVTDPASRHLYFAYGSSSSRLATSITSDLGLSLSYLYDGQGRLIKVTKPDQTTLSFEFDTSSNITAVRDSDGKILESHTYDGNGRGLTSSRAGGVEAVTVSYPTQ